MIKMLFAWIALTINIAFGISCWRELNKKERWKLTKLAAYATICSVLAVLILYVFVILF